MRICFDVDGVLAQDKTLKPYAERMPYPGIADKLKALKAAGHTIVILTARYMVKCNGDQNKATAYGLMELIGWLQQHNIPYDEVYLGKPSADVYVDDRACRVESNLGNTDWENLYAHLCL